MSRARRAWNGITGKDLPGIDEAQILAMLEGTLAHDIQTRTISAAARQASANDKYQSGFFFTTRQIDPIAMEI